MAEILTVPPTGRPALVLNADFRPLSYYPLSLWPWQEVIKAVFLDRVDIIAEYDHVVRSPSREIRLPSVIALREFVHQDRAPAFTRFNVFLRDGFACAYCGAQENLTFDLAKGGRLLKESGLELRRRPFRPNNFQLQEIGRRFPPNYLHETWMDYLYWDVELEL